MSNAHQHALYSLKAAATCLLKDGTPTLQDFKNARELAKSATITLDSAVKLLEKGIHSVVSIDEEEGTTLFGGAAND